MNWLRVHRDVIAENRDLRERCVDLAQENDKQRAELRAAADMFGHLKRQVQDAESARASDSLLIDRLHEQVAALGADFDALVMGVGGGGAG